MPTTDPEPARNAFERDKPGTAARTQAERAIEEVRQRGGVFVEAVRATRLPMVVTDPTLPGNPIVFANSSFLRLSGYKMEEVLGQQPQFMNGSGTDPNDAARFAEALRSDQDDLVETVQYRKNGSRFVASVLVSAFKDEEGRTIHHFISWLDVTRRVDAEQEVGELRNIQAALRASEAKYRGLFDSIDEGFCVIEVLFDAEGRPADYIFLETNPAFQRQTGIESAVGRRMREIAPEHEQHWFDIYGRIAMTGEPERFEQPAEALGRYYEVYAFPIGSAGQNQVAILFNDIGERKRAEVLLRQSEERQAFLLKLTDALRPIHDASEIQATTARMVAEHLGADRAMYAEVEGEPGSETGTLRGQYVRDGDEKDPVVPFPEHFTFGQFGQHTMAARYRGEPLIVNDVQNDPQYSAGERAAWAKFGVRAAVVATLPKLGRLVAEFGVHSTTAREWTDAEITLIKEVAERTWADAERARAETALRASEQKYRSLFETMGQGYCELELIRDEQGRAVDQLYLELNPAFERLFGIPAAEAKGRRASEVFPFIDPAWHQTFDEVARTGTHKRFEHQHGPLNPWFEVFAYPSGGDRVIVFYEDITERKRAEVALRQSGERQAFLLALGDAMRTQSAAEGKIAVAARLLGEKLDASRVLYAEYDHENGFATIFNGWLADGVQPFPSVVKLEDFEGEVLNDLREGRLVRVDDVGRLGEESGYAAIANVGVQALLSPPLLVDGTLKFNVSIHQHEPRHWTDEEVALVEEVSERLWAEIERARAEEALVASEAKYRLLFETMSQGYGEVELLRDEHGRATDVRYLLLNPAFERFFGIPVADAVGRTAREILVGIEDYWFEVYDRVSRSGQSDRIELELGPSGGCYALEIHPRGGDRLLIVYDDITERKRAEAVLRESEGRQAFLLKLSDALRPLSDPTEIIGAATRLLGEGVEASRAYYVEWPEGADYGEVLLDYAARDLESLAGRYPRDSFRSAYERIQRGDTWVVDDAAADTEMDAAERDYYLDMGVVAWVDVPIFKRGRLEGAFCLVQDRRRHWSEREIALASEVAERTWAAVERARAEAALRDSERHANILLAELQHRVRNTLAVVRAIARRTAENSDSAEDMLAHFQGRLDAFSRVQAALTRSANARVDLASLIDDELVAHAARGGEQFSIEGPPVALEAKTAERLSLAIHELTTNAVKHGALVGDEGKIRIRWRKEALNGSDKLIMSWVESGVDCEPGEIQREGFGMELLRRSLPYDLRAQTEVELRREGLRFELSMAIPAEEAGG